MERNRKFNINLAVWLIVALSATFAIGQSADPTVLSICQLLDEPGRYAGKQVTVRAEVIFPRSVLLIDPADPKCGRIPWAYPSNPEIKPKPKFSLVKDENFKNLMDSLGLLLPPPPDSTRERSKMVAVLEGRFDWVYQIRNGKLVRTAQGFGHLSAYDHVFVLRRVIETEIIPAEPLQEGQDGANPATPRIP